MSKTKKLVMSLPFFLLILLGGCNNEVMPYELINFKSKVTEHPETLQLVLQYEVENSSDEDYYLTFTFPSYIQEALAEPISTMPIPADSSSSGQAIVAVSKKSGQLTEKTIAAILNGELPYIEKVVIGKAISME